jgi:hypothetical protein
MDAFNIIVGIISIVGVIYTVMEYERKKAEKKIELHKLSVLAEKLEHTKSSLYLIRQTADLIVQRSKTTEDKAVLGDLSRTIRANTELILNELDAEKKKLINWEIGKQIDSKN